MPPARLKEPAVPAKVKQAVEFMYSVPGATLQSTAAHVKLTTRKLRYYFGLPHVLRWLLQDKQARLEVASAGNLPALLSVRDYGDNAMARVHSSKVIEGMLDAVSLRTGIGRAVESEKRQPGLQIVILPATPIGVLGGGHQVTIGPTPAPLIESTPVEQESDTHG